MSITITERTQQAEQLKRQGRYAEALEILRDIARGAPNNVAVLHNYAACLGDLGRHREAIDVLNTGFAKGLNAPESWLVYARAQAGVNALDAAQEAFLKLLALRPSDPDGHRDLAQLIWMRTGDQNEALVYLNRAIERNPNDWGLHITRAKIFGQTGDPQTSYAVLAELANRSGGAAVLETAACNAALAINDFNGALAHGRRAATAAPTDDGAQTAYVCALLANGELEESAAVINQLRDRQPLNQLFIALQATVWRLAGDARYYDLMDYERFVQPSPLDTPKGWNTLEGYVSDLIEALDAMHCFEAHPFAQSVKHGSQISSITTAPYPALKAFEEAAHGPVARYLERLGEGSDSLRRRNHGAFHLFSAWSIRLPANGFHINHVHPEGWISSACHLRASSAEPDSPHAGSLKFGEPGVATQPEIEPELILKPEPGVLVLFPSYMWHGTVPFGGNSSRLTIAADFHPTA